MRLSTSRNLFAVLIAAGLLAGCETDGNDAGPFAALCDAVAPGTDGPAVSSADVAGHGDGPEPPMTRRRAATECWMATEKGSAGANLDKRADTVTKCIDDKMKNVAAAPKG